MANKKFFIATLVIVLVFGMTVSGCEDPNGETDTVLNGRWVSSDGLEYNFNNGDYDTKLDGTPVEMGTYTTKGSTLSTSVTKVYGTLLSLLPQWYTRAQLKAEGYSDADLNELFIKDSGTYSVNGNTLTIKEKAYTKTNG